MTPIPGNPGCWVPEPRKMGSLIPGSQRLQRCAFWPCMNAAHPSMATRATHANDLRSNQNLDSLIILYQAVLYTRLYAFTLPSPVAKIPARRCVKGWRIRVGGDRGIHLNRTGRARPTAARQGAAGAARIARSDPVNAIEVT